MKIRVFPCGSRFPTLFKPAFEIEQDAKLHPISHLQFHAEDSRFSNFGIRDIICVELRRHERSMCGAGCSTLLKPLSEAVSENARMRSRTHAPEHQLFAGQRTISRKGLVSALATSVKTLTEASFGNLALTCFHQASCATCRHQSLYPEAERYNPLYMHGSC